MSLPAAVPAIAPFRSPHPGPYLRGREEGTSAAATAAYEQWRRHHELCPRCGLLDWYEPSPPRFVAEAVPGLTFSLRGVDGRDLHYINGPDLAALCQGGAQLFRAWQAAAAKGR